MAIKIAGRPIGEGYPCFFIAEAGVNHNGNLELARRLVDVALAARADAVKFQKRSINDVLTAEAFNQPYSSPTALGTTYGEHRQKLELSEEDYRELSQYCEAKGIIFLASAWDIKSADFIESLGVPAYKIASADVTNLPLLTHIAQKKKPVILSTGMSTLEEIDEAVETIKQYTDELIILHCTSAYPFDYQYANLNMIKTLRERYGFPIGYSGHEKSGHIISMAAVAMGACVVERHFTLDHTMRGPDHAASLEPHGLTDLIESIKKIEKAFGSPIKDILDIEAPIREKLAKSIVAAKDIKKGQIINRDDLTVKSPGNGLKPRHIQALCSKIARKNIPHDTLVPPEALKW